MKNKSKAINFALLFYYLKQKAYDKNRIPDFMLFIYTSFSLHMTYVKCDELFHFPARRNTLCKFL